MMIGWEIRNFLSFEYCKIQLQWANYTEQTQNQRKTLNTIWSQPNGFGNSPRPHSL